MVRTVALVGHSGSGKTTLGEALLYVTGGKDRMGKVEEGSTTSDYTPEEKAHRVSVRTAVLPIIHRGHRIYLLDAPGYADFVGEIRGALEAADSAVVVVSAEAGVQIGTERAWTVAERLELPRMVVVSKLEKGGDFFFPARGPALHPRAHPPSPPAAIRRRAVGRFDRCAARPRLPLRQRPPGGNQHPRRPEGPGRKVPQRSP